MPALFLFAGRPRIAGCFAVSELLVLAHAVSDERVYLPDRGLDCAAEATGFPQEQTYSCRLTSSQFPLISSGQRELIARLDLAAAMPRLIGSDSPLIITCATAEEEHRLESIF